MFSKTLLVLLIFYFASDFSHGKRDNKFFRKDYHYIEALDSFYKIHKIARDWSDAKRLCALEGASLFYPDNDEEAHSIISFWNTTQPGIKSLNVGLSDLRVEGYFDTVDGKSVDEVYNNWMEGEPNNNQRLSYDNYEADCVVLFLNGYISDHRCEEANAFICKKKLRTLQWNHHCNMPNIDYTFNKGIGKCYKLHMTPLNWDDAYAACRTEQSSLAVINDQKELDFLVNLTEAAPQRRFARNYQRGIFHLGFHNKYHEGWQTVKDSPMNDASLWWGNEQPEVDDDKQCGSMFYTGRLNNISCDTISFFICEHEVVRSGLSEDEEQIQYALPGQ